MAAADQTEDDCEVHGHPSLAFIKNSAEHPTYAKCDLSAPEVKATQAKPEDFKENSAV